MHRVSSIALFVAWYPLQLSLLCSVNVSIDKTGDRSTFQQDTEVNKTKTSHSSQLESIRKVNWTD